MSAPQTLQSGARGLYSSVDRCQEYHKVPLACSCSSSARAPNHPLLLQAIMVDPVYEVNPLTALVDLSTKLLLHPLSR